MSNRWMTSHIGPALHTRLVDESGYPVVLKSGEGDVNLLVTQTRYQFMNGSSVHVIEHTVVREEL